MKKSLLCVLLVIGSLLRADDDGLAVDGGVDVRLRYDFTDNLPKWPNGESERTDYMRLRTRLWGRAEYRNAGIYLRLADEFRYYRTPKDDPAQNKQKFPDVLFIDSLYFDFKDLAGRLDLRLGRQEMKLGSGRLISDGTGGDGSRSAYFDAMRLTWRVTDKSSIDFFGIYAAEDDWLPTLGKTNDGKGGKDDYNLTGFGNSEAGAGIYALIRESKNLGMDFYWLWKHESKAEKFEGRSFHTVGARFLPRLTETLSAELELAGQLGETDDNRDIAAFMVYSGLTWKPAAALKPYLTGALLYLSGDDQRFDQSPTGRDTGWNPTFNRQTWLGEAIAPMYDKYRYSNLVYPHVEAGCVPLANQKVKLQFGPMFTARDEAGVNTGAGHGAFRGFYVQGRYEFLIAEKIFGDRGTLKGGVQLEYMTKGDYFGNSDDGSAYFARFEISVSI